jgi:thioredoxin reductase (NADPH)
MSNLHSKVLIIGSGPAGYTAAIYAARANLKPILVTGHEPGGQLMVTTDVENYPGFQGCDPGAMADGADARPGRACRHAVGDRLHHECRFQQAPFHRDKRQRRGLHGRYFDHRDGREGALARVTERRKIPRRGVSACATCDGFFFKGKEVAIVGGGNTAAEEAIFLTNFCSKVTLIHRRDSLKAEKILQDRLFKNPKINVIWDTVIEEIVGDAAGMTGLKLKNIKTGKSSDFTAHGLFIAIGHDPATELFKGKLKMDASGYIIKAPDSTATDIPGVFAAGDVADHVYRQAVTAAGMGCMAALEADRYLAAHTNDKKQAEAAE